MWRCKEENFGETDGDQYAPSCLDMLTAMSRLWVPAVLCIVSVSVAAGQQTIQTDQTTYPPFSMRCSLQETLKNCTPGFPTITVDSIDIEFSESSTTLSLCEAAKLHVISHTNRMLNYFENECPGELAEDNAFRVPVKTYMDAYSGHCQQDVSSLTPKNFRAKININCNPARAAPKPTDAKPAAPIVTFPQAASLTTAITTKLTTKAAAVTPSPTTASSVPSTSTLSPSAPSQSALGSTQPSSQAKTASTDSSDPLGATDSSIAATRYADPPTTSPDLVLVTTVANFPPFSLRCSTLTNFKSCAPAFTFLQLSKIDVFSASMQALHTLCPRAVLALTNSINAMINYFENDCLNGAAEMTPFSIPALDYVSALAAHCGMKDVLGAPVLYVAVSVTAACTPHQVTRLPSSYA